MGLYNRQDRRNKMILFFILFIITFVNALVILQFYIEQEGVAFGGKYNFNKPFWKLLAVLSAPIGLPVIFLVLYWTCLITHFIFRWIFPKRDREDQTDSIDLNSALQRIDELEHDVASLRRSLSSNEKFTKDLRKENEELKERIITSKPLLVTPEERRIKLNRKSV
jgi:hypothetical protein